MRQKRAKQLRRLAYTLSQGTGQSSKGIHSRLKKAYYKDKAGILKELNTFLQGEKRDE